MTESDVDRVLIVDDEEPFLQAVKEALLAPSRVVTAAADVPTALEILKTRPQDIVIVDLNMPEISGIELIETIRAVTDATEVVVCTAYPSRESRAQAKQLRVTAYLTKPINLRTMSLLVTTVLQKRQKREIPVEMKSLG